MMTDSMELSPFDSLYPAESRFDEIEKILNFIREGNSCQVVGLPGVGRSNLLGFFAYNRIIRQKHLGETEKQFHFLMINFSEVKKQPLFAITKLIFLTLIESLQTKGMESVYEKVHSIFKDSLSYQDELILFQGLKKTIDVLAIEQQLTVVFLFERFETYIPMLTADFFTNLRVLRDHAKYHFSVIFSLNRPLEELIEPTMMADFYEFIAGHIIYLPISDAPGNAFRIAYLEKATGKKIDTKTIDTITSYTAGHGKLTRICMEVLLVEPNPSQPSLIKEGAVISPLDKGELEGVDFFLQQKRVQGVLYEIWHALSPLEQTCLASDDPCDHAEPTYLEMAGICKNKTIAIPLLAAFAKQRAQEMRIQNNKIIFNPKTNTITKGDLVLSDTLTISEFRLLQYLLEHQQTIVNKEEIVSAVWQDAKTTAGVSDQAIDQLIFRLRKKIEDDPNISTHLETIKGRGIRFYP